MLQKFGKNKINVLIFILAQIIGFHSIHADSKDYVAKKGILDLRQVDLMNNKINLKGEWRFSWRNYKKYSREKVKNHLNKKENSANDQSLYMNAPSRWNVEPLISNLNEKDLPDINPMGYGTYSLTILFNKENIGKPLSFRISNMSSSYELYINGHLFAKNGKIGTNSDNSIPQYRRLIRSYTPMENKIQIDLLISNFHDPNSGGFWKPIWIGSEESILADMKKSIAFDLFLLGALTIMSFYHFGLYLLRHEDKSSLAFGIITLIISIRILFTGELLAMDLFPNMSWEIRAKWEFLSFYLALPVFHYFLYSLFPKEFPGKFLYVSSFVTLLFALDVLIHPMAHFGSHLYWFQTIALLMIVYALVSMGIAIYRKREGSIVFLAGLIFFFSTVIFDIMMSHIGTYDFISPFGLFVFIFSQSFILSLLFSKAYRSVQFLSNRLTHTNRSFQRFVPEKLLSLLNKEDITAIELGEQTQADMPVLFSDIRSFTELSESMNPEENFNFLNSYLKRMGPIIRSNNGFIDKYLGDGIMALFPGGNENALIAAVEMLKELKNYNEHRKNMDYKPIKIGIGLHRGKLMLGTIGESERMDATVISDSVNTASRIENLTKTFGCSLLISGEFFFSIENQEKYDYRVLGKVKIRGKKQYADIIEIFNEDEKTLREGKRKNLEKFNKAVSLYRKKNFQKSYSIFSDILNEVPDDKAAQYYYNHLVPIVRRSAAQLEPELNPG